MYIKTSKGDNTNMKITPSTGPEKIESPWLLMSPTDLITEE